MPMAAGTLMAVARAHKTMPTTGWRYLAAVIPATRSPTMMASLWAPPIRANRVSGLSRARVNAAPGSRP